MPVARRTDPGGREHLREMAECGLGPRRTGIDRCHEGPGRSLLAMSLGSSFWIASATSAKRRAILSAIFGPLRSASSRSSFAAYGSSDACSRWVKDSANSFTCSSKCTHFLDSGAVRGPK